MLSAVVGPVQLARSSAAVIQRLVPTGVDCFLKQLLQLGETGNARMVFPYNVC